MLLSGTELAKTIYQDLKQEIQTLEKKPCLGAILVGDKNSPSLRYINQKKRNAKKIGLDFQLFHLDEAVTQEELLDQIYALNNDAHISGYIVQLPLPKDIDTMSVIAAISPEKDVDGFHPINQGKIMIGDTSGFTPCTPAGIIKLLESRDIQLSGKKVVVIGKSNIVGKPLVNLCMNMGATVINCNSKTPDISVYTKDADIVISATGISHLVQADMIGKHTVVIDVGFSVIDEKLVGDTDTESIHTQGNLVTPVPGGVGPMTVAMLMSNTLKAHKICNR